ncbi:hypothetical protein RRG08_005847 [Elysia crispata]|uniref:Uncharacterized protein n=1 Tax=Elysia crispata TaxID=231223 RepID=A0AAE1B0G2_9GAST|nr:hypothetical protein RRG08_005847 [Elysia crispata]
MEPLLRDVTQDTQEDSVKTPVVPPVEGGTTLVARLMEPVYRNMTQGTQGASVKQEREHNATEKPFTGMTTTDAAQEREVQKVVPTHTISNTSQAHTMEGVQMEVRQGKRRGTNQQDAKMLRDLGKVPPFYKQRLSSYKPYILHQSSSLIAAVTVFRGTKCTAQESQLHSGDIHYSLPSPGEKRHNWCHKIMLIVFGWMPWAEEKTTRIGARDCATKTDESQMQR